jgi:hypothetical protein
MMLGIAVYPSRKLLSNLDLGQGPSGLTTTTEPIDERMKRDRSKKVVVKKIL